MSGGQHVATIDLAHDQAAVLADLISLDERFAAFALDSWTARKTTRLTLYLPSRPGRTRLGELDGLVRRAGNRSANFTVAPLPERDWVAEGLSGLPPVRAGRFLVHGRHVRSVRRANDIAIEIEAAQAFGTGHHGTTAGCLTAIEAALARRWTIRRAADIGTGTGLLAIAIARMAHVPVVATDIDPVATATARANARHNGVAAYVQAATAIGTGHALYRETGPFDLIVANILAGPLARLATDIRRIAAPGARIILSGLLPDQQRSVTAAYRNTGLRVAGARHVDGWLTLAFDRPHRQH